MREMMRSLLVERFKLTAHTETRMQAVFDLVVAKAGQTGPQLRAHTVETPCSTTPAPSSQRRDAQPRTSVGRLDDAIPCASIGFVNTTTENRARIAGNDEPMERIAGILKSPFTQIDRPVRDRTGLTGTFDFTLDWSITPDSVQVPAQAETGPNFQEALLKQLGLKLLSSSGPVDVLVIDHVEHPTEN
jgi:uncharacterized protein (TIGR03435 family)